jgi:5-methylcytosine-specific restriction endonuclease McrA
MIDPAMPEAVVKKLYELLDITKKLNADAESALDELISYQFARLLFRTVNYSSSEEDPRHENFLRKNLSGTDSLESWKKLTQLALREGNWREVKPELERLQENRCASCGCLFIEKEISHVDHKVPIACGGKDEYGNLQVLCADCNLGKGAGRGLHWLVGADFTSQLSMGAGGVDTPKSLRFRVLLRAGFQCEYIDKEGLRCNKTSIQGKLKIDHKFSLRDFPTAPMVLDNLRATCEDHQINRP